MTSCFDFIDLHEAWRYSDKPECVVEAADGTRVTVTPPRLSFRDRLGVLFGKPLSVHVGESYWAVPDPDEVLDPEDAKVLAERHWLTSQEDAKYSGTKLPPTPQEQIAQMDRLLAKAAKPGSPYVDELLKTLPERDVLEIKLPRHVKLTSAQKTRIRKLVLSLISGGFVAEKATTL